MRSIGIAGTGRVAQALGRLLVQHDQPVVAIAGRNPERAAQAAAFLGGSTNSIRLQELPKAASHVLIAVSDAAIEPVASILSGSGFQRGVALHTCGATGPEALQVLARAGVSCGALHPMQSFATPEQALASLPGSVFAIDGTPRALDWATSIVCLLGGQTIHIGPEHRAIYHAAAAMAGNYVITAVYAALKALEAAQIDPSTALRSLAPLVRVSAENALRLGPVAALTGPIQRGDSGTVLAHLQGLERCSPSVKEFYRAAGLVTLEIATQRGLTSERAADIREVLLK